MPCLSGSAAADAEPSRQTAKSVTKFLGKLPYSQGMIVRIDGRHRSARQMVNRRAWRRPPDDLQASI